MRGIYISLFLVLFQLFVQAQTSLTSLQRNSVPQSGGIGEIGVVSSDQYYETGLTQNPALLCNKQNKAGIELSYMPWLMNKWSLIPDTLSLGNRIKTLLKGAGIYNACIYYPFVAS